MLEESASKGEIYASKGEVDEGEMCKGDMCERRRSMRDGTGDGGRAMERRWVKEDPLAFLG